MVVTVCHAAEVTVLAGGAVKAALEAAAKPWAGESGNTVKAQYAPAGEMLKRLAAGERPDIVVIPVENLAALEREGVIDAATRRDLAVVSIGVAVRKGDPVPDISTPGKLRDALLAAPSVLYMDPTRGTSGKHVDEVVLPRLGIRDAVRAKATLGEGGYIAEKVARGEAALVLHSMTEMAPVQGISIAGPLPRELQKDTIYAGVVTRGAGDPRAARGLLEALSSPRGREAFSSRGYGVP
ncbi:MAG TPA: substrate-binding domain-containing protein [Usitatibacter sp.]|nr:substrate-binding domain-containing protein [Usitatibacter sp.]